MLLNKYCDYIKKNKSVQYSVDFQLLPPVHAAHKWVGAQYINNYLYGIPNDMEAVLKYGNRKGSFLGEVGDGLFKWTGGCIWKNCLYGFSRTSNTLLKISLDTEKIEYIEIEEKYQKEHHYGGVCTKNGIVYQPPRDSDHLLVWDLKKEKSRRIKLNVGSKVRKFRYCGSVLHPNGCIYFLPELDGKVIKFDIETEKWNYIGGKIDAMVFDAKIAVDGFIYGYSAYCKGILKIDVATDSVEMIHKEIEPGAFGTKLGVNGKLYSIPGDGRHVWQYDPLNDSLESIYEFLNDMKAKYAGGVTAQDGNIYAVPAEDYKLFHLKANDDNIEIPNEIWETYFLDCY